MTDELNNFGEMFKAKENFEELKEIGDIMDTSYKYYKSDIYPIEKAYHFNDFHSNFLMEADFKANPMILLVGQYSTGKTSFIKFLLDEDFDGMRIGPEPTTDGFMVVAYGKRKELIPGNSVVMDPNLPLRTLEKYGNKFLSRLQGSMLPNDVLKSISFIDTPGILSGSERNVSRGYPYNEIIYTIAERVDTIIVMLDAHSLDLNQEFTSIIKSLSGFDDKIKIVLNKSDQVDNQELMRVYGALMWSLGNVMMCPEVPRVYISNFSKNPLRYSANKDLIYKEAQDLYDDIMKMPRYSATRKLNSLARRLRLTKVHMSIISHLKSQMPIFGKDKKKKELIENLKNIFSDIASQTNTSIGDFPDVAEMQQKLEKHDFSKFKSHNKSYLNSLEDFLKTKLPKLIKKANTINSNADKEKKVEGGIFRLNDSKNIFMQDNTGVHEGKYGDDWIVSKRKDEYDEIFYSLKLTNNKLNGLEASSYMRKSNLPNTVLANVWNLSDIDKDGYLDADEFALSCHLISIAVSGKDLPIKFLKRFLKFNFTPFRLPDHLIPASKIEDF